MTRGSTICLNLIVRDDAGVIEETLRSVAPYVDTWVVVDTGSVDATPEVVESVFADLGLSGTLHRRPWRDFATNRTEALELAREAADYTWVIDADDLVVGTPELDALGADAYQLRYGPDLLYWRTQIVRSDLPWRYVGEVHEYLTCDVEGWTTERVGGNHHVESRRRGRRSRDPNTYRDDAARLLARIEDDPTDARAVFYLAQSLRDAGDLEGAAAAYRQRATMGGWDEECFVARLRLASCLDALERPDAEVVHAHLDAWQARPSRAEPLHHLARRCRRRGHHDLAVLYAERAAAIPFPDSDRLFVEAAVYRWSARDELALGLYETGRHAEAFDLWEALLAGADLPDDQRDRILVNRDFCVPRIIDARVAYPDEVVRSLCRPDRPVSDEAVTLTVTTCRRYELFEKTMNSFLRCCTDLDRIGRFVCIDDGSSDVDRERMRARYPFFEFVWKDAEDKGHGRSMNMLLDLVDTPRWMHLEDDWLFFAPGPLVGQALDILDTDPEIGQVALNWCYGERVEDRALRCGERRVTPAGVRFGVHEHIADRQALDEFVAQMEPGTFTMAHWPHFTLMPSVIRTEAMRDVGRFEEEGFFESGFARRWTLSGWKTAFLDRIGSLHIGRLRSETSDPEAPPNAYELNDVSQFTRPPPVLGPPQLPELRRSDASSVTMVTCFVDLSRRQRRPRGRIRSDYLAVAGWTLGIPAPMVVYAEPDVFDTFRALRPPGYPTDFVPVTLESFRWWDRLDDVRDARRRHPPRASDPVKESPEYHVLGWERSEMIADAAERDPFGSPRLAWMDLGLPLHPTIGGWGDLQSYENGLRDVLELECDDTRIRICCGEPLRSQDYASWDVFGAERRSLVGAAAAVVPSESAAWFAQQNRDEVASMLGVGRAMTAEPIWARIVHREPTRFRRSFGPWWAGLANLCDPRTEIDWILRSAAVANSLDEGAEALARLDFVAPALDDPTPERWFAHWDERMIACWSLGDEAGAAAALAELAAGAGSDPGRRRCYDEHRQRLETNAAVIDGSASTPTSG